MAGNEVNTYTHLKRLSLSWLDMFLNRFGLSKGLKFEN